MSHEEAKLANAIAWIAELIDPEARRAWVALREKIALLEREVGWLTWRFSKDLR